MSTKTIFTIIGLLGLGLRIMLSVLISPVLASDSLEYHQYGENLVREHRYYIIYQGRQAPLRGEIFYSFRPPGYPFLVALIYAVAGIHPKAVCVLQAFLDFFSTIFIFLIARNWLKPKFALWAFAGAQVHFLYVPMLLSETFFLFLFCFCLWICSGKKAQSWFWMGVNGIALGWLILTKPEKVIFVPLFFGYILWKNYSKEILGKSLVGVAIMSAVIAPWLWREEQVHGRFVWFSSRGGRTFFEGNYLPIEMRKVYAYARKQGLDEIEMDRLFYQVAFQYLRDHPEQYFKAGLKRVALLFDLRLTHWLEHMLFKPLLGSGDFLRKWITLGSLFLFNLYRLVVILGALSALIFWRKFKELWLIYSILILLILFHFTLFIGASRYLVPAYPSLCIFFGLLMQRLGELLSTKPDSVSEGVR